TGSRFPQRHVSGNKQSEFAELFSWTPVADAKRRRHVGAVGSDAPRDVLLQLIGNGLRVADALVSNLHRELVPANPRYTGTRSENQFVRDGDQQIVAGSKAEEFVEAREVAKVQHDQCDSTRARVWHA